MAPPRAERPGRSRGTEWLLGYVGTSQIQRNGIARNMGLRTY
jgi:hypothetical protein